MLKLERNCHFFVDTFTGWKTVKVKWGNLFLMEKRSWTVAVFIIILEREAFSLSRVQNQPSNLHRSACVNFAITTAKRTSWAAYRDPASHNSRFHGRIIAILWNPTRNRSRPPRKTAVPTRGEILPCETLDRSSNLLPFCKLYVQQIERHARRSSTIFLPNGSSFIP